MEEEVEGGAAALIVLAAELDPPFPRFALHQSSMHFAWNDAAQVVQVSMLAPAAALILLLPLPPLPLLSVSPLECTSSKQMRQSAPPWGCSSAGTEADEAMRVEGVLPAAVVAFPPDLKDDS